MLHVLENISIINLRISLWQGTKSLKISDLAANGIDISKLPPGKLASLGSKRTITKEATKHFMALKRAAQFICSVYGIKFGENGYAVPNDKIKLICTQLARLKTKFSEEKQIFIDKYDEMTEEWVMQNDYEWRDIIRNAADSAEKAGAVFLFNFSAFKINPVESVENGLEDEVGGLHTQLCKEIRGLASITLKTSYINKTKVGKRALRPIKAIALKLSSMSFLDESISNLAEDTRQCLIDAATSMTENPDNVLTGKALNETIGVLTQLSNLGLEAACEESSPENEDEELLAIDNNTSVATPIIDIPNWDF